MLRPAKSNGKNDMKTHKITGDVHIDIDTVYDMVNYTESLVNGLVEEWQAQNLGVDAEYMELLDTQNAMKIAVQNMYKIKSWRERKRFYGPLAGI